MGRDAGDAPHDVDTEPQPLRQRPEAPASGGGGEALRVRRQPGVFVQAQLPEGQVLVHVPAGVGPAGVPLDVHHHVLPAEGEEALGEDLSVGADLGLGDGGVIAVVAVPAHGGRGGKSVFVHQTVSRFPMP